MHSIENLQVSKFSFFYVELEKTNIYLSDIQAL